MSRANEILVDGAEIKVSNDPTMCLKTPSLGSGVAVMVYDPEVHVGGVLHFLMPAWEIDKQQAVENPSLFGNSGIPQLYRRCYKFGADKSRMKCYLVGGADVLDPTRRFLPGQNNLDAAKKMLEQNGVTVNEEWTGGQDSRVARLFNDDGRIVVETVDTVRGAQ